MTEDRRPKLAVWKFASCDGCQLSLLDCEDELLMVAGAVQIAQFTEATRTVLPGPYDISLVEGSITTPHDAERIREIRRSSKLLITIGACATAGGVQALRNTADVAEMARAVYPHPEYLDVLATSTPIADHVDVDLELRGCPIDKGQLLHVLTSLLAGRPPQIRDEPVCVSCKRAGVTCILVAEGRACLGPVTHGGCGALCPRYDRGCFGCYGPAGDANPEALARPLAAVAQPEQVARLYSTINPRAEAFERGRRLAVLGQEET